MSAEHSNVESRMMKTINLLAIEYCSLSCAYCSTGAPFAKKIHHSAESFCKYLDLLVAKQIPFDYISITGGEPFLHPEVRDGSFFQLLKDRYPSKKIGVTTNFSWASVKNIIKYAPIIRMLRGMDISMYVQVVDRLGGQEKFNRLVELLKEECPNTHITIYDQSAFCMWELHNDEHEVKQPCCTSDCFILKPNGELSHCSIAIGAQNTPEYNAIVKMSRDAILDLSKIDGREEFLSWAWKYPFDLCFHCTMWRAEYMEWQLLLPLQKTLFHL